VFIKKGASRYIWSWLASAVIGCSALWAQPPAPQASPNDVSVQALLKRIEELESSQKQMQAKIEQLTGSAPAGSRSASDGAAAAIAAQAAQAAQTAQDATDEDHVTSLGPVKLQGFSDFDFGRPWFEKQPANGLRGSTNSFNIGDFDLFVNTRISDHWSVLGELLISSDFSNEFGAEMDRLMVTYTANDYLKVSFGKYASAIGYYTNAFHRALFFQTGVSRPIMFADEDNGGILPVHNIGVTATGKIPSGRWGLHWVAEVANGRSASVPDVPIQNFVDENNGKSVNFAVYTRPEWLPGFQTGVSLYRDTLHPLVAPSMGELIPAAYAAYIGSRLEWLNEIALVRHAVLNGGPVYNAVTSYSQISWAFGKTRPYFRYDYQNTPVSDPILGSLGRENGPSIGVAEHLSRFLILKLQYGRLTEHSETTNTVDGQIALAF
jgi:hypothetical protein